MIAKFYKFVCYLFLFYCFINVAEGVQIYRSADATADDYFNRITVASAGRLTRFDCMPITIYVGPIPLAEELHAEYLHNLEVAFSLWEEASQEGLQFERVSSPTQADIRLNWTHKSMRLHRNDKIGEASLVREGPDKFYVEIMIILRDACTLKLLDHNVIRAAILHELGHAVGLWGHSPHPGDVMFHAAAAMKPTKRDIATLRAVYATPQNTAFHQEAIASLKSNLAEDAVGGYNPPPSYHTAYEVTTMENRCLETASTPYLVETARLHYLLGTIYADMGDYDTAISEFQKALAMTPDYAESAAHLAMIFDEKGMYSQAIAHYMEALKLRPSAALYGKLGTLYLLVEDFESAIQHYRSGLRFDFNSSVLKHNLLAAYHRWGFKLIKAKRYFEALQALDTALARYPFSPVLLYDRAIAYSGAKQYEQAIDAYKLILELEPEFSAAKIGLASVLNNLGVERTQCSAWDTAVNLYSEALEWDSECWQARQNLESLYLRLGWEKNNAGECEEAIATYQRVLALNPNNAHVYDYLGIALYKQKRYDEAIAAFETALTLEPEFAEAESHLKYARRLKIFAILRPFLSVLGILLVSAVISGFVIKRVGGLRA